MPDAQSSLPPVTTTVPQDNIAPATLPSDAPEINQPASTSSPIPPPEYLAPEPPKPKSKILHLLPLVLIGLAIIGIIFFAFRLLSSRGGKGASPKGGPVTLTMWGLWEPENVMQGIISEFESANPGVKISYTRQSPKDYRERLQNALTQGSGPDIFRFHNTWVPMFKNYLSPLPSQVMDNATFDKTFYPVARKDLKISGKYVGLPLMIDALLLYYNEDLLASAGVLPPKNWDELLLTSDKLMKGGIQAVALGNSTNVDHWQDILALLMIQNGTDMKKPGSTIGSDGKNLGADALSFYTVFIRNYKIWDDTFPSSTQAFASGKLALYFGPSWEAFEFAKNPSLKFQVTKTPTLVEVDTSYATYWADGVSESSKNQKEAWEFLKFLVQKENLQKIYEAQAKTRLFGEPPSRIDMAGQFKDTPIVSTVLQSAPTAVSWYLASNTWDGQSGLNSRLSTYFADAVTAVNKGTSAEEALKTVDQGVLQVLNQYGIK